MSRRLPLVVAALATAALACADPGNPDGPTSLAFGAQQLPAPYLVLRDTLRDTLGLVVPLRALVYDGDDDLIPDAPVTYAVLDTANVILDAENRLVSRDTTGQRSVRVQAVSGALVSAPVPVTILPAPPDTIVNADAEDQQSRAIAFPSGVRVSTASRALRALVRAGTAPVTPYFVEFRVVARPAVLDSAWFTRAFADTVTRAAVQVDTTDGSGIAERFVRARLAPNATPTTATLTVRARIRGRRGVPTDSVDFPVQVSVQ